MEPLLVISLQVRVNLRIMAMKEYSTFSKLQETQDIVSSIATKQK